MRQVVYQADARIKLPGQRENLVVVAVTIQPLPPLQQGHLLLGRDSLENPRLAQ
ncbi:MAG: hypothetical protein JO015_08445 [Verrucomicrobia bacterium]|nr:hypothetical protein [Verrucomicrobiota bacterium]